MARTNASMTKPAKSRDSNPLLANRASKKTTKTGQNRLEIGSHDTGTISSLAASFLKKTDELDKRRRKVFLDSFRQKELVEKIISDPKGFADILKYAFDQGFVRQIDFSKQLGYANSQVGRWAANKSSPPMLVRKTVIKELCEMVKEAT